MSRGSTHGIGRKWNDWQTGARSSGPGFSRSGRNSRYVGLVHQQRGGHVGGMDGVDADRVLARLHREGPHQADDAVLGRDVMADLRVGLGAAHRTGDDHGPAAATGQQVRDGGLDRLPHAAEVDVDGLVPDVLTHLVQLHPGGADARVGHDDVQSAELLDPAVDGGLQRLVVADVDDLGDDASIEVLDHVGGLGEVLGGGGRRGGVFEPAAYVDRDDVGALLGQPHCVTAALAARRTRDECDLALDPSSHCFPRIRRGPRC